jgi:hypothetical protein
MGVVPQIRGFNASSFCFGTSNRWKGAGWYVEYTELEVNLQDGGRNTRGQLFGARYPGRAAAAWPGVQLYIERN